jgi:HEAT repeat protein
MTRTSDVKASVFNHIEPPLFDSHYFGWLNGRRILDQEKVDFYCAKLIELLNQRKLRLRWIAADQLGKIGRRYATEPLIAAMSDSHWLVRLHAAKALGRIGDPRAIEPLVRAFKDENASVRGRVATALGRFIDDEHVFQVLASALNDPSKVVRASAAAGMSRTTHPNAIGLLAEAVRDESADVSWRAVVGLQRQGVAAIEPLLALLSEKDNGILYRVIKTLGYVGDSRAGEALETFLQHPDGRVRWRAGFALDQIARRQARGWH